MDNFGKWDVFNPRSDEWKYGSPRCLSFLFSALAWWACCLPYTLYNLFMCPVQPNELAMNFWGPTFLVMAIALGLTMNPDTRISAWNSVIFGPCAWLWCIGALAGRSMGWI